MYTVIEAGGFQHKVSLGETLEVSKIDAEVGSDVTIPEVLLFNNGKEVKVGNPLVPESNVVAEVLAHGKGDKIKVFKKKRRKGYRRTAGHRQQFTTIMIKEMNCGSENLVADKKILVKGRSVVSSAGKGKEAVKVEAEAEKAAAATPEE